MRLLPAHPPPASGASARMELEVFSDFICPWCYIAHRRLAATRAALAGDVALDIVWRPFELNPDMPAGGEDRRRYRTAKFGSWEKSQALDAGTETVGAGDGVSFRYDLMTRTPNTFAAHRVVSAAAGSGRQDDLVERIFRAYFAEGRDIGETSVLRALGAEAGLSGEVVETALTSDRVAADVRDQEARAVAVGLRGVPHHLVNGRYAIPGAAASGDLEQLLRDVSRRPDGGS